MSGVERGQVVKLGPSAQELHTVIAIDGAVYPRVLLRQHTTGKLRWVQLRRCIVVARSEADK